MAHSTHTRANSAALFAEAQTRFPGGVNSPVRAFGAVGGTPLFIDRGEYIWDADGQRYIDFCCSWGPLILGRPPGGSRPHSQGRRGWNVVWDAHPT